MTGTSDHRIPLLSAVMTGLVLLWSAVGPHDYFTWFLEIVPAIAGFIVLAVTYQRFRLTSLVYVLIGVHASILMVGGHYTYAEVPLFNTIRDLLHQTRNNYDKLGHFAQGFVPSILVREVLLRTSPLRRSGWLITIVLAICLAVSALYELFEWQVAVLTGTAAEAFLGTQGDPWDTQSDMAFCLVGSVCGLLLLSRWHDVQLRRRGI
jgi:putative membrane protein